MPHSPSSIESLAASNPLAGLVAVPGDGGQTAPDNQIFHKLSRCGNRLQRHVDDIRLPDLASAQAWVPSPISRLCRDQVPFAREQVHGDILVDG